MTSLCNKPSTTAIKNLSDISVARRSLNYKGKPIERARVTRYATVAESAPMIYEHYLFKAPDTRKHTTFVLMYRKVGQPPTVIQDTVLRFLDMHNLNASEAKLVGKQLKSNRAKLLKPSEMVLLCGFRGKIQLCGQLGRAETKSRSSSRSNSKSKTK